MWVIHPWDILLSETPLCKQDPQKYQESEEHGSEAWVQGAGPLASEERASSPSAEGWRELETRGRERYEMIPRS